jgi:16S rRNA (guanine527-N7)-methyltransferase
MSGAPMPRKRFGALIGAAEVTLERLDRYEALLGKWQKAINLIGPKTLPEIWERHFLDSAQFWKQAPPGAQSLADIGSGGGFPGLVLAALAADPAIGRPGFQVHLIESDQRKASFLREAARVMDLSGVTIHAARIESLGALEVDMVTARACAPLAQLLIWSEPMLARGAVGLFAKGAQAEEEMIGIAGYRIERIASATDPTGCLLRIESLAREGENHDAAA